MREYMWKAMRPGTWGGIDVVGFYEAPPSSVLAGQTLKQFLGNYPEEAAAREAHPEVTGWTHPLAEPQVSVSHLPGEDDPVPGGMYPDDYDY